MAEDNKKKQFVLGAENTPSESELDIMAEQIASQSQPKTETKSNYEDVGLLGESKMGVTDKDIHAMDERGTVGGVAALHVEFPEYKLEGKQNLREHAEAFLGREREADAVPRATKKYENRPPINLDNAYDTSDNATMLFSGAPTGSRFFERVKGSQHIKSASGKNLRVGKYGAREDENKFTGQLEQEPPLAGLMGVGKGRYMSYLDIPQERIRSKAQIEADVKLMKEKKVPTEEIARYVEHETGIRKYAETDEQMHKEKWERIAKEQFYPLHAMEQKENLKKSVKQHEQLTHIYDPEYVELKEKQIAGQKAWERFKRQEDVMERGLPAVLASEAVNKVTGLREGISQTKTKWEAAGLLGTSTPVKYIPITDKQGNIIGYEPSPYSPQELKAKVEAEKEEAFYRKQREAREQREAVRAKNEQERAWAKLKGELADIRSKKEVREMKAGIPGTSMVRFGSTDFGRTPIYMSQSGDRDVRSEYMLRGFGGRVKESLNRNKVNLAIVGSRLFPERGGFGLTSGGPNLPVQVSSAGLPDVIGLERQKTIVRQNFGGAMGNQGVLAQLTPNFGGQNSVLIKLAPKQKISLAPVQTVQVQRWAGGPTPPPQQIQFSQMPEKPRMKPSNKPSGKPRKPKPQGS